MKNLIFITLVFLFAGCSITDSSSVTEQVEINTIRSTANQSWVEVTKSVDGNILKQGDRLYIYGAELRPNSVYNVELELLNNWELRSIKYID